MPDPNAFSPALRAAIEAAAAAHQLTASALFALSNHARDAEYDSLGEAASANAKAAAAFEELLRPA